ncbi:unnamed protein product [Alopecurus aequalis]
MPLDVTAWKQCIDKSISVLLVKISDLQAAIDSLTYIVVISLLELDAWGDISCAFPENDLRSRVIVTTRIQSVAKSCCSQPCDYVLNMKPLSDEDSRRLFYGRIFNSEEACPQKFKDVSIEILKKCGGLPLAIISISGLLASGSPNKDEWECVRNSLGSMNGTELTLEGMRQILNLSYKDLTCQLKTCLLYLGMYPEDYTIERSELEHQGIAEGFVCKQNGQDVEKISRNYFNELINRSLIQPVTFDKEGSVTECKVHDIMLDLILLKSAEQNFLTIVDGPQAITGLDYKVRRLSLRLDDASNATVLPGNITMSQVRSVMIFGRHSNVSPLSEFKFLRVLYADSNIEVNFIGLSKLYQLRYLMTRSIQLGLAHNIRFPSDAVHLPHLLHLSIGCNSMLPDGIGEMKSLVSLSGFSIQFNSLDNIKSLGELTNLTTLTLTSSDHFLFELYGNPHYHCDRDGIPRRIDLLGSSLRKLDRLESLYLYTCEDMDGLFASSPLPCSLQRIHTRETDWACWFSRVPNLIKEHHNLRELQLQVLQLPMDDVGILAELPSLVILELNIINHLTQMVVIYGGFPVLKCFGIGLSRASSLTFQAGTMPMLQRLQLNFSLSSDGPESSGPAGIEHLPALENVSAIIKHYHETESEKRSAESALRGTISIHSGKPHVEIYFSQIFIW